MGKQFRRDTGWEEVGAGSGHVDIDHIKKQVPWDGSFWFEYAGVGVQGQVCVCVHGHVCNQDRLMHTCYTSVI